jgi:hypothetical protein
MGINEIKDITNTAKATGMVMASSVLLGEAMDEAEKTGNLELLKFSRKVAQKIYDQASEVTE